MASHYDTIVLGVGGVGSAALYHLAQRGQRVLGIERFEPVHDRGSSHGQTRLIRQAYYEHPDYVPLLKRAYALWHELSAERGLQLLHQVGVLQVGRPEGQIIPGILASALQHQLDVEELSRAQVETRFPGFRVPEPLTAVFEARGGYLLVEECVRAHIELALRHGAELRAHETVLRWHCDGTDVSVETAQGVVRARSLIITAGAWSASLLRDLEIPLQVTRKPLYWYDAPAAIYDQTHGCPGFIYETALGNFYGFPRIDRLGLKVAEHSGGETVANPLEVDRSPHADETTRVEEFLDACLPGVSRTRTHFDVCLYTLSPDRKFVVDRHPEYPQVSFAAGLSGHGFKFASVLGEALADLAQHGSTQLPIGFLSCRRPELQLNS
jgi:monomeric sarcosine oxidase